jgi:hypothetical protein
MNFIAHPAGMIPQQLLSSKVRIDPVDATTQKLLVSECLIVVAAVPLVAEFQNAAELRKDY